MRLEEIYDDETLRQINKNVNLLEYVGQFIEMKRQGSDYFGRCPLHIDNTPSFCITPAKNLYYCFSCGKAGGIISYLINYEGLSFEKAVGKAAGLADMDLNKICKSNTIAFLKKIRSCALRPNIKFQHDFLDINELKKYKKEPVCEWVNEGIKPEVLDVFGVMVDAKQNRIVYPVYDIDGNLINIKARTRYPNYKKMKIPKYINYYPVGVMDYFQGLNITLPYIKEKNEVVVFESIKSVMKMYGWGYKNCVSAEKHTLTEEQENLLIKLRVNIVFAYDADINYRQTGVKETIEKLKRLTNVYIIEDKRRLLGGAETKNSPADCGKEVWDELYNARRKIT